MVGGETRRCHPCCGCVDIGLCREPGDHHVRGLVDENERHRPEREDAGAAEAGVAPVKAQPPHVTTAQQDRDEDERLQRYTDGRADAKNEDLG